MAFNLFKRRTVADVIFTNGTIYTMTAENPIVTSIVCNNGIIIALGEESIIEEYRGAHTQIIDLQNKFILPGFIEINGQTVNRVFEGSYLKLDETMSIDHIISNLSAFQEAHPHEDCYLAYGYNESLIDSNIQMQVRESIDQISNGKPIIAIASDGIHLMLNSIAVEIIQEKAEEMEISIVTPAFAMGVLISSDYVNLIKNTCIEAYKEVQKGYTCTFNKGTFHYFDNTYRDILIDMFQADMIKQRSFGSFLLNRQFPDRQVFHLMDQGRTACSELEGKINFDTLYIKCSGDQSKSDYMSSDYLDSVCGRAADKGYNIRVTALDKASAVNALNILGNLQPSYKKSSFTVEYAEKLTEEELSHIFTGDVHIIENSTSTRKSPQDMIEDLTAKAADCLGISNMCGSLEQGKWADFAAYSVDPTTMPDEFDFETLKADTVVLNGEVIYKNGESSAVEWAEKMTGHVSSVNEDFFL